MVGAALVRLEIILAVLSILGTAAGVVKSAYNGWLRNHVFGPLDKVEKIDERTKRVEENQNDMADEHERLTDAVIALGESHRDGDRSFDVREFRRETDRKDGSEDFLNDD